MKHGSSHLTYCTNIHPGEKLGEVLDNLQSYVRAVRAEVAPERRMGVGLRLGAEAAFELTDPERLRESLAANDLYVFTINGFPYGTFHGTPVKEAVYRPDWREAPRVRYTDRLADILAGLLDPDLEGSISTVPGGFKPICDGHARKIAHQIARNAAKLIRIERDTGKKIVLALEPEPFCLLETTDEAIAFFEEDLCSREVLAALADLVGIEARNAESAMRRHVGLCLDTCHAAVEFEEPHQAIASLRRAGIRIAKVQLSAGLRIPRVDRDMIRALESFDEPVYLHQVVERTGAGELIRYRDLPQALSAARARGFADAREWRVHFHVPIFLPKLEHFDNTQAWLAELLAIDGVSDHFEVETYTWNVLPDAYRREDVVHAIARELEWALGRLAA
jgi:sugar phosphate isomerase/epimerase